MSSIDKKGKVEYNGNMNKVNYDKIMAEQMATAKKGATLLLHSCCAPCSSACLERLKDVFAITVLYYNPNIDEEAEYEKCPSDRHFEYYTVCRC